MIPEAAVEAAVAILRQPDFWEYGDEEATRAALEAAAPHMRQAFYLEMNARAVEDELNTPFRKATYSDD